MIDAGKAQRISVLSFRQFRQKFFSFENYESARKLRPFGSAVDPDSGDLDDIPYIGVKYAVVGSDRELSVQDIAKRLHDGSKVILIGDYGAGKSRCVREAFYALSEMQSGSHVYPISIDLRDNWGLKRYSEVVRRHFDDLGLSSLGDEVLRGLPVGAFVLLLDGFDELGSQAWSVDTDRLRRIRAQSLEGVKDLIAHHPGGLLITGRAHYFNNDDEMMSALGLNKSNVEIIHCKEEFDADELQKYFDLIDIKVNFPDWLPRKPLICKTIASLDPDDISRMFEDEGGDIEFWQHFLDVLCRRDVRIHNSLDPDTLHRLLKALARLTRSKTADVGPLSLSEIQNAFEGVVGQAPVEQASQMLQRLPGLGRVKAESDDRQFVDTYILDGLRATDLMDAVDLYANELVEVAWRNPLDQLGQRIFARLVKNKERRALQFAEKCASGVNRVLASDIIASLSQTDEEEFDFRDFALDEGHFLILNFRGSHATRLRITNSTFSKFVFPVGPVTSISVERSYIGAAYGVTSSNGLPNWIVGCEIDKYEAADNLSRIRQIGLKRSHEILVGMLRKTFFQKGAGRKEEALTRGLGRVVRTGFADRILTLIMAHDVFERFKGDEGWVYTPNRKHTARAGKILAELNLSRDPLWLDVGELD